MKRFGATLLLLSATAIRQLVGGQPPTASEPNNVVASEAKNASAALVARTIKGTTIAGLTPAAGSTSIPNGPSSLRSGGSVDGTTIGSVTPAAGTSSAL